MKLKKIKGEIKKKQLNLTQQSNQKSEGKKGDPASPYMGNAIITDEEGEEDKKKIK